MDAANDDVIEAAVVNAPAISINDIHLQRNNLLTVNAVRDAIVSQSTSRSYVAYNFFLIWLFKNNRDCLTTVCVDIIAEYIASKPGAKDRAIVNSYKEPMKQHFREAFSTPLIVVDNITASMFMEFLTTLRHSRKESFLGRSAYQHRRSALYHLYRLHNHIGFTPAFASELSDMYKGLFRVLSQAASNSQRNPQQRQARVTANANQPEDPLFDNDDDMVGVGPWATDDSKSAMSVQLYRAMCGWFLDWQTNDGIFAHCFLVLTWNLACRVNNTACIKFSDINWKEFDCYSVTFSHSKTDQVGEDSRYPRHIFSNHVDPVICPVLALSMYFSCCFAKFTAVDDSLLFQGPGQEVRFSRIFKKLLDEHRDEVRAMGYEIGDLGTHSIRKGAATYLTSIPGGPPVAASSQRGGWSMGNIKDRYFKYQEAGDQYVGRCLCLLPILSVDLASSPPFFDIAEADPDDIVWINGLVAAQFSQVIHISGFGLLLRMCFASHIYHRRWIVNNCALNHVIIESTPVFRNHIEMTRFNEFDGLKVTHPWNDSINKFTGVPPHCVLLQEIAAVRSSQNQMLDSFVDKVKEALVETGVTGGQFTEQRFQCIFDKFQDDIRVLAGNLGVGAAALEQRRAEGVERVETGRGYKLHTYGGRMHRVPRDWRIPRCTVFILWRSWWIGDTERHIPPLRFLDYRDIEHVDAIPLSQIEKHRRTGYFKAQRRKASKTLSDIRYLARVIMKMVKEENAETAVYTIKTVDNMFKSVAHRLIAGCRDDQKQWVTVVRELRRLRMIVDDDDDNHDGDDSIVEQ